ncbi:MAG: OmpA family protein, partial [Phaeodactylibacter sp.]|nr:OmpA family protein [Phaeodactylibacter sp.]
SDMPGGYGGYDLYFVERRGNSWSSPINLGPEINTAGNEAFPFIHDSGFLFFSSNGRADSEGGLDVYMINISSSSWGKVTNLGRPFNSAKDDLGFILDPEGSYGFFASDRPGGYGKDDIYRFELPDGIKGINSKMVLPTRVIAYDKDSRQRLDEVGIRIFQRTANGFIEGDDAYNIQLMPSSSGSNELVMKLVQKNPTEIGEATQFTNANGELDTELKAEKNFIIVASKSGYKDSEVSYSTLGEDGEQTIRIGLSPQLCATVEGKVIGGNSYGGLPFAVVRIVNECDNQEHVVRTDENGIFDYCVPLGCKYMIYVEKEGFGRGVKSITTEGYTLNSEKPINVEVNLNPIADAFRNKPIEEGTIIVLEQIYYDFNKSAIRKGDARELDALAKLMIDYPSMEIDLIAHTDSRGSDEYNMELSLKRAESAKKYLVSRGVNARRINAIGYGESQLRNNCGNNVNCSEEQHQYNRRTEVKVSRISEPVKIEYKGE